MSEEPQVQAPLPTALFELLGIYGGRQNYRPTLRAGVVPVYVLNPSAGDSASADPVSDELEAFHGFVQQTGAAGQVPEVQLYNPGTSQVYVLLDMLRLYASGATICNAYRSTVALTTAGTVNPISKVFSGSAASPAAQFWRRSNAGAAAGDLFDEYGTTAGAQTERAFAEPIVLYPGYGITLRGNVVAGTIDVSFAWRERPIT